MSMKIRKIQTYFIENSSLYLLFKQFFNIIKIKANFSIINKNKNLYFYQKIIIV